MKEDRRLAHSGLGDKAQESTIRLDAIVQRRQCFAMGRTEIQESRVRGHTDRLFPQSEILLIHAVILAFQLCARMTMRLRRLPADHQARISRDMSTVEDVVAGTKNPR